MIKNKIFLPILILLTIASGCEKDENNPISSYSADNIMPLKTGNRWIYTVAFYDTSGNVVMNSLDTMSIVGTRVDSNETWFQMNIGGRYLSNRSTGLWEMDTANSSILCFQVYLYPAKIGDSWTNMFRSIQYQVSVASIDVPITVPAGAFACYQYRISSESRSYEYDYLSSGVGLIRLEVFALTNSGRTYKSLQMNLVSFCL